MCQGLPTLRDGHRATWATLNGARVGRPIVTEGGRAALRSLSAPEGGALFLVGKPEEEVVDRLHDRRLLGVWLEAPRGHLAPALDARGELIAEGAAPSPVEAVHPCARLSPHLGALGDHLALEAGE